MTTTIKQLLGYADELHGLSESPQLDVEIILGFALNQSRETLYSWPERSIDTEQVRIFHTLLKRRKAGEPIAYIVGKKSFWEFDLQVNPGVLIPRPETELLVEKSLALFGTRCIRVCDLGTGSGAIALALGFERPAWSIMAIDSSTAALGVAKINCQHLALSNIEFVLSCWCEQLPFNHFDLIVSNPPYIDKDDPHLTQGDLRFEPRSSLVSPDNGLGDIARIAEQARDKLTKRGWLLFEHGFEQTDAVTTILRDNGYHNINSYKDLAGHYRVTAAQR